MSKSRYFAFRTLQTVFMLWVALTFLFLFFRAMPGSYLDFMVISGSSQESIAHLKDLWGLNDPVHIQYLRYLENLVSLNAGTSLRVRESVWSVVQMKIFNSFILIAPAITLSYIIGSVFGTVSGTKRGSKLERYGIVPFIFVGAFPSFFTAILLVIIFAGWLGWFPTGGLVSATTSLELADQAWYARYLTADFAMHYVLPFAAVMLRYLYLPALIMRTNVIEVLDQDFIFYHRISGLPYVQRLRRIARHASLPVITLYPVSMTRALGGLVLIETVFNWPGIGHLLVQSVISRDIPVVQFVFFLVAAWVIISNYVIDLLYGVIDPRVTVD